MNNSEILNNVSLCQLSLFKLNNWINEKNLLTKDYTKEKYKWKKQLENNLPLFFSDTELLAYEQDIILLEVEDEITLEFLAKTYQIKDQRFCHSLFGESKHLLLITKNQWETIKTRKIMSEDIPENLAKCIVLFKDETTIKDKLTEWLNTLQSS